MNDELPMTPQELRAIRLLLGRPGRPLSQAAFGELVCRSQRSIAYYEAGKRPIPREVARLARAALASHGRKR